MKSVNKIKTLKTRFLFIFLNRKNVFYIYALYIIAV